MDEKRIAEIEQLLASITQGEWFYGSYSAICAADYVIPDDEYPLPEGCRLGGRYGDVCAECESMKLQRCKNHFDYYDNAEPAVAFVPAAYGDTATGRHQADADFIAQSPAIVRELLAVVKAQLRV